MNICRTTTQPTKRVTMVTKRPTFNHLVQCDCGAVATHVATFLQFNSAGQELVNEIRLCPACYAELVAYDRNLLSAGALHSTPGARS